jgi:hypothetical protein
MNSIWFRFCPVFVLALGLISCKKGADYPDNFRVQDPTWERYRLGTSNNPFSTSTDHQSFREASTGLNPRKLGDYLVFKESSVNLKVLSRCIDNKGTVAEILTPISISNAKRVSLASMLPEETLYPGVLAKSAAVRCSIHIEVVNAIGSIHKIDMDEQPIEDDSEQIYSIDWQNKTSPTVLVRTFDFKIFASIRMFSLIPQSKMDPALLCTIQSPQASQEKLRSTTENANEFILTDFPWQKDFKVSSVKKCRAVGIQNGAITNFSRTFDVTFSIPAPPAPPGPSSIIGDGNPHYGRF